jgi:phage terminase large subunit
VGVLDVVIPYAPRTLQRELHRQADAHRFGTIVCHRRFGKTVFAVNHLEKRAVTCRRPRPRTGHIFPTYRQGKAVGWDYAKFYAAPIPGTSVNESELRIDFPNGGQYRIFGADNPDSLRGLYFDDVVFDEFGMQPPGIFSEVLRPALSDREGGALFLGTPNGKNQFYEAKQTALSDQSGLWFFAEYKASQTGIIPAAELAAARAVMTTDEYEQEYECSFEASVKGALYAREIQQAHEQARVTRVPYEPLLPVHTSWDLGVGDSTAIWFAQFLHTGEIRVIDYYENTGQGLAHYADVLNRKGYTYGDHWAPHDIKVRELGSGVSRIDTAANFGIHFRVVERFTLEDGIQAVRMMLPKCWFDGTRCARGLEALQHYKWDYNTRIHEHKPVPVHDWASHGADAFRMLALKYYAPKRESDRDRLKVAQMDASDDDDLPVGRSHRGGFRRRVG